jgi:cytochrome c oxidase subunit IV
MITPHTTHTHAAHEDELFDHSHEEVEGGHHFEVVEHGVHHPHGTKKQIWQVFFILLAVTVLEFLIALTPSINQAMGKVGVVSVFFGLTIVKAFYIVGYFMHLKQEKMNMAYSILIPILFILYLIALLLFEGSAQ